MLLHLFLETARGIDQARVIDGRFITRIVRRWTKIFTADWFRTCEILVVHRNGSQRLCRSHLIQGAAEFESGQLERTFLSPITSVSYLIVASHLQLHQGLCPVDGDRMSLHTSQWFSRWPCLVTHWLTNLSGTFRWRASNSHSSFTGTSIASSFVDDERPQRRVAPIKEGIIDDLHDGRIRPPRQASAQNQRHSRWTRRGND